MTQASGNVAIEQTDLSDFDGCDRGVWSPRSLLASLRGRFIMPRTMGAIDPASEWLRLSERYRRMSDGELVLLARQESQLTDGAKQALAGELSQRGLKPPHEEPPAPPNPEPSPDSPYAEDRELVEICTVWSLSDALQLQAVLDRAGIPFFIGSEKARRVEAGTMNFGNGVTVWVMRIGLVWAFQAMQNYTPANEPLQPPLEDWQDLRVHCPRCHSKDVVFERLSAESKAPAHNPTARFEWTCHACGFSWEDDGTARDA